MRSNSRCSIIKLFFLDITTILCPTKSQCWRYDLLTLHFLDLTALN